MRKTRHGPKAELFASGDAPLDRSMQWRHARAQIQDMLGALMRRAATRAVRAAAEEPREDQRLAH